MFLTPIMTDRNLSEVFQSQKAHLRKLKSSSLKS